MGLPAIAAKNYFCRNFLKFSPVPLRLESPTISVSRKIEVSDRLSATFVMVCRIFQADSQDWGHFYSGGPILSLSTKISKSGHSCTWVRLIILGQSYRPNWVEFVVPLNSFLAKTIQPLLKARLYVGICKEILFWFRGW